MIASNGYEEQTRRLLAETQSELRSVETQIDELRNKAGTLAKEVDAYETALQGYQRRTGKQTIIQTDWRKLLKNEKYHKDKLKAIAKQNGGNIRISEATDILYTNGFIKTKKRANAYIIIQSYLAEMAEKGGSFEKVAPGEYRLKDAQPSLLK